MSGGAVLVQRSYVGIACMCNCPIYHVRTSLMIYVSEAKFISSGSCMLPWGFKQFALLE
jgi:hypothetical protein